MLISTVFAYMSHSCVLESRLNSLYYWVCVTYR